MHTRAPAQPAASCLLLLLLLSLLARPTTAASAAALSATATAPQPPSYTERYGGVFVWHALSAALAWGLVAPAAHLISRHHRRVDAPRAFLLHRGAMVLALALTAQTFLLGLWRARDAPQDHLWLGSLLTALCLLQGAAGGLRPAKGAGGWRRAWFALHRGLGVVVMALGVFVLHHSVRVFGLGWKIRMGSDVFVGVLVGLVVASYWFVRRVEDAGLGLADVEKEGMVDGEGEQEEGVGLVKAEGDWDDVRSEDDGDVDSDVV